ncbi:MAG TPA: hypothetical protein VF167_05720 [Longimicrobiaceae bacterium]
MRVRHPVPLPVVLLALFALPAAAAARQATPPAGSDPIILDASDFIHEIQKNHVLTDAASLDVPWIFNNTALEMRTRSNYLIRVPVAEAGRYYLYARTHGSEGSYFRIAVGDRVIEENVGDAPLRFERVGAFDLPAGEVDVRLMRIEGRPVLDVLVLSRRDDITVEELRGWQLDREVRLLREYDIPASNAVKFGDLTGDGQIDFLVLTRGYSAHAFDHQGNLLWSWEAPAGGERLRAEFEAPGVVWDLDGDGAAEAIHWRQENGQEWLVAADGRTGKVKYRTPWPTRPLPHVYNNFRLAIGRLAPGEPQHVLVYTDSGDEVSVAAYDRQLRQLWNWTDRKRKDHLGHYVYPIDVDGDGIDEVLIGSMMLDAHGKEVWNRFDLFYDHHDHVDSYRVADLDGDGTVEAVAAHSEVGVVAYRALTGEILWQNMGEHSQQIEIGDFRDDVPGLEVAIGARTYGNREAGEPYLSAQVWWFDAAGNLVSKWPGMPLNGNPVFVKGDWHGDGKEELFWYKFRLLPDGTGTLYFGEPVFHMFDFLGNGAEEVITLERGKLRVYGYVGANPEGPRVPRDSEYLRYRIANHTHY